MRLKLSLRNLNSGSCLSHPINTYTCRVTVTVRKDMLPHSPPKKKRKKKSKEIQVDEKSLTCWGHLSIFLLIKGLNNSQ